MPLTHIDATTLKNWLDTHRAILIDVREADEFKTEHIFSAFSLPLSSLADNLPKLQAPDNVKIVIHCLSGKRGGNACAILSKFMDESREIYNLEGGISAWKQSGYPTISASVKTANLSIFRQVQIIVGGLILLSIILGFALTTKFFVVAGLFSAMLIFAGISGWCGLANLLQHAPWNK